MTNANHPPVNLAAFKSEPREPSMMGKPDFYIVLTLGVIFWIVLGIIGAVAYVC